MSRVEISIVRAMSKGLLQIPYTSSTSHIIVGKSLNYFFIYKPRITIYTLPDNQIVEGSNDNSVYESV